MHVNACRYVLHKLCQCIYMSMHISALVEQCIHAKQANKIFILIKYPHFWTSGFWVYMHKCLWNLVLRLHKL